MKTHQQYGAELMKLRTEGASWLARRDAKIRAASEAGMSLRTIASYIGLSQTGVQKILQRDRVKDGAQ